MYVCTVCVYMCVYVCMYVCMYVYVVCLAFGSSKGSADHVVCGEVATIHSKIVLVGSTHGVVVHATVLRTWDGFKIIVHKVMHSIIVVN